jgi:hypothetical protein
MSPALLCCCHLSVSMTLYANLRMIQKIPMSPGGHRLKLQWMLVWPKPTLLGGTLTESRQSLCFCSYVCHMIMIRLYREKNLGRRQLIKQLLFYYLLSTYWSIEIDVVTWHVDVFIFHRVGAGDKYQWVAFPEISGLPYHSLVPNIVVS